MDEHFNESTIHNNLENKQYIQGLIDKSVKRLRRKTKQKLSQQSSYLGTISSESEDVPHSEYGDSDEDYKDNDSLSADGSSEWESDSSYEPKHCSNSKQHQNKTTETKEACVERHSTEINNESHDKNNNLSNGTPLQSALSIVSDELSNLSRSIAKFEFDFAIFRESPSGPTRTVYTSNDLPVFPVGTFSKEFEFEDLTVRIPTANPDEVLKLNKILENELTFEHIVSII